MGSLEGRVSRLEERRVLEATQLILACARAASLDDIARFVTVGVELEQKPELDEEDERRLWRALGCSLEVVRAAAGRPELWHAQLGDLLADRRGLRGHLWEHYPATAAELYSPSSRERLYEKG
jgi:hypothetical protein